MYLGKEKLSDIKKDFRSTLYHAYIHFLREQNKLGALFEATSCLSFISQAYLENRTPPILNVKVHSELANCNPVFPFK